MKHKIYMKTVKVQELLQGPFFIDLSFTKLLIYLHFFILLLAS